MKPQRGNQFLPVTTSFFFHFLLLAALVFALAHSKTQPELFELSIVLAPPADFNSAQPSLQNDAQPNKSTPVINQTAPAVNIPQPSADTGSTEAVEVSPALPIESPPPSNSSKLKLEAQLSTKILGEDLPLGTSFHSSIKPTEELSDQGSSSTSLANLDVRSSFNQPAAKQYPPAEDLSAQAPGEQKPDSTDEEFVITDEKLFAASDNSLSLYKAIRDYQVILIDKVKKQWNPPDYFAYQDKPVTVTAHIQQDGTLADIALTKRSNSPEVDALAITAIKLAAPFPTATSRISY